MQQDTEQRKTERLTLDNDRCLTGSLSMDVNSHSSVLGGIIS